MRAAVQQGGVLVVLGVKDDIMLPEDLHGLRFLRTAASVAAMYQWFFSDMGVPFFLDGVGSLKV